MLTLWQRTYILSIMTGNSMRADARMPNALQAFPELRADSAKCTENKII